MKYHRVTLLAIIFGSLVDGAKGPGKQARPPFRIGIYEEPYGFQVLKSANGTVIGYDGAAYDIADWLARRLNYSFTTVVLSDYKSEQLANGTWTGNIALLLDKKVDYLFNGNYLNPMNHEIADYIANVNEEPQLLMLPPPQEESRLLAPVKPFTLTVWMGLIASMLILSLATYFIFILENHVRHQATDALNQPKLTEILVGLSTVILGQGGLSEVIYSSFPKRLAACVWCLTAIIIVNGYTSSFISFATTPKFTMLANNVHELAFQSNVKLLVVGTSRLSYYYNSSSPAYLALGEQLQKHPENIVERHRMLIDRIATGCCATIHLKYIVEYLLLVDYEKTKQCRASIIKTPQAWEFFAFLAQKGDPLAKNLSAETLWMKAHGLWEHWFRSRMKPPRKCLNPTPPSIRPLKLVDLSSAFVLLSIGLSIGFMVFVYEVMTGSRKMTSAKSKNNAG